MTSLSKDWFRLIGGCTWKLYIRTGEADKKSFFLFFIFWFCIIYFYRLFVVFCLHFRFQQFFSVAFAFFFVCLPVDSFKTLEKKSSLFFSPLYQPLFLPFYYRIKHFTSSERVRCNPLPKSTFIYFPKHFFPSVYSFLSHLTFALLLLIRFFFSKFYVFETLFHSLPILLLLSLLFKNLPDA